MAQFNFSSQSPVGPDQLVASFNSFGTNPVTINGSGVVSVQAIKFPDGTVDVTAANNTVIIASQDMAIPALEGTVIITKVGSAANLTLAQPIAGTQGTGGGQDGQYIRFIPVNNQANVITTALHGINGNKNVATLVPPSGGLFLAYNGTWYNVTNQGATLSGS